MYKATSAKKECNPWPAMWTMPSVTTYLHPIPPLNTLCSNNYWTNALQLQKTPVSWLSFHQWQAHIPPNLLVVLAIITKWKQQKHIVLITFHYTNRESLQREYTPDQNIDTRELDDIVSLCLAVNGSSLPSVGGEGTFFFPQSVPPLPRP